MAKSDKPEAVAVVGMGCRWPGGVHNAPELWDLLVNQRSGYREFGAPRFSAEGFYHPDPKRPGSMATRGGYLVDEDPRLFDPTFFGMSGLEVENMDPSQRKLLEVVYEAIENAGDTWESISGTRTGVFVGNFSFDHWVTQARDWDQPRPYALTGASTSILSNRISYIFNLHGPSLALDTACSSSMYAVHLAVNSIRSGDCDSAIVAASNFIMDPGLQMALDKLGALSPTSACHTFDASADGYARGEGFAALYLKRASYALADASPIRGFIRGTAVNANGRTGGITRPSTAGQEAVIRQAYRNAGDLTLSDTVFCEMHGTGTPVGDPIEVAAVGNAFSKSGSDSPNSGRLLVGSIKTNLGHAEGASALAGIMKVILSLESGLIPPSIGIRTLNPEIDFHQAGVEVVRDVMPWPEGKLRRASVNSFGFGGANGHCIIDHVNVVLPHYIKPMAIDQLHFPPIIGESVVSNHSENGHKVNGLAIKAVNIGDRPRNRNTVSSPKANGDHINGVKIHESNSNGHVPNDLPKRTTLLANAFDGEPEDGSKKKSQKQGTTLLPASPPQKPTASQTADANTREFVLLPFSAHSETSLQKNIDVLHHSLKSSSLADVVYTLGAKRSKLSRRTFRIINVREIAASIQQPQPIITSPAKSANVGFVFTGQGAQWHGMGAEIFEYQVFRSTIDYLDHVIANLQFPPNWSIQDVLLGKCSKDVVNKANVSQVVCTAIQIGVVNLLDSWSIRPVGVAGHSSGEIAAVYAAGHCSAAEAIAVAYFRGLALSRNQRTGAMLAVGLGEEQAAQYLSGLQAEIKVAALNSPGSITLSGEENTIKQLSATLTKDGIFNRILQTGGNAYHSHHMVAIGGDYETMLSEGLRLVQKQYPDDVRLRQPPVFWASSVIPDQDLPEKSQMAAYWRANLESTVRFSEALSKLVTSQDIDVLVEIGPHGALKSPVKQILNDLTEPVSYVSSLMRQEDGRVSLLRLAGNLFGLNAHVDMKFVNSIDRTDQSGLKYVYGCLAVDLPPYQHTYGPVNYLESRTSREYRLRKTPRHDLIGSKIAGNAKLRPQWRSILRLKDLPWLADHCLLPHPVFPAAGYLCMAMVAASQVHYDLSNAQNIVSYSLRNVAIKTAMILPEDDYGIEVMLCMELVETMGHDSPAWSTFSISSVVRNSDEWTEHCTGAVKIDVGATQVLDKIQSSPGCRSIDSQAWYKTFTSIGLGYGPTFQGLSDLQADPEQSLAFAKVALNTTETNTGPRACDYPIHPASLDSIIQLGLIASYGGQYDKATTAFVPINLNQMVLRTGFDQDWATAAAIGQLRGLRGAYTHLQMINQAGEVVLDVDSLRHVSYGGKTDSSKNAAPPAFFSPFMRMVWKPDIRTLNEDQGRELFPPPSEHFGRADILDNMNRLAALIVVEIYDHLDGSTKPRSSHENVNHFIAWIKRCVREETDQFVMEAKAHTREKRLKMLDDLYTEMDHVVEVQMARRIHDHVDDIFHDRRTGVDILVDGGLLTSLYEDGVFMTGAYPQLSNLLDCLGHANPHLKILEIGAGTGGATRVAMNCLRGAQTIKRYGRYTYTDVSPGFLTAARESMKDYHDMDYAVLDIEADPTEQGFEPVYDVVMASQVLHATRSISETLKNCRKLLKPGGKLLLVENTTNNLLLGIVLGTLTGYWHGIPDGRTDGPFLSLPSWDSVLKEAAFSGTEVVLDDNPHPHNTATTLLSTLLLDDSTDEKSHTRLDNQEIKLLHGGKRPPFLLSQLNEELARRERSSKAVSITQAASELRQGSHVIAFLDEENLLLHANQQLLETFQHIARSVTKMTWITSCGIVKGRDPTAALVAGLLRTIGSENPSLQFRFVDIDAEGFEVEDKSLVQCLADLHLGLKPQSSESSEDHEFAWQDGCLWVSRLVPEARLSEYSELFKKSTNLNEMQLLPLDSQGPICAAFESPGILSSLYFRPYTELLQPLQEDYIEVKVAAVGLNWKDLGLTSGRFDADNLSSEYTGMITKVGSSVTAFAVGDRVYGMGRGNFGNYTCVPAAFAQKLEANDNIVEMATMPLVYMTAIYAFEYVTNLQKGQTVLIQSASGGLGLSAIQVARAKGAEVYVTAGTSKKMQFLIETIGVPASNVFSSHDISDLLNAAATTSKGGFDVILSTAKGDLLYASMRALAPLGCLIDVGRMDVQEARTIGLELFQKSASFSSFDLTLVLDNSPLIGKSLMRTVDEYYRAGKIGPIRPYKSADISKLDQVLLGFSKGTHTGKLVMTFQDPESLIKMQPSAPLARFNSDACYIVTGGLSGLGRSIIRWMSDHGAQHFTVLSRRGADSEEARTLNDSLKSRGIHLHVIACDVGELDQVEQAIRQASSERTIKGIVHAAVSYQDLSFDKMTIEQWQQGLAAKVLGTMNLHAATRHLELELFVMTTSVDSVFAPATQSAYIAANNFQDYFARYRRRCGLPASTASFGLVSDVGHLSEKSITADLFARNKVLTMTENQFLSQIEPAFLGAELTQNTEETTGDSDRDPLANATYITCMDPAAMAAQKEDDAKSSVSPRWYHDGRVSLVMQAMDDALRHGETANLSLNSAGKEDHSASAILRREFNAIINTGPDERAKALALVLEGICAAVAEMLFLEQSMVDGNKSIADHGVDSLIAAELRNWFHVALAHEITTLDLLDARTSISTLAANIVDGALDANGTDKTSKS